MDIETLFDMVKTLLAQRFKLAVHLEERPMPAYTMTAARPKMKKADPRSARAARRAGGAGEDGLAMPIRFAGGL